LQAPLTGNAIKYPSDFGKREERYDCTKHGECRDAEKGEKKSPSYADVQVSHNPASLEPTLRQEYHILSAR
jgi:hypothetical protein